ncbi:MAG: prepilin peptidase [Bdellovibrionaceae bacterium]|nr:prepilin peptidase [Pseudobdellovibrionaceae bacterium]
MSMIYLWVSVFLSICVVMDLLYAKVFNSYILASLGISILLLLLNLHSISHWSHPLLSFALVFVIGLALFKFKILGAGDVKSMLVVALFLNPNQSIMFLAYSIIWGGVFSLVYFLAQGSLFRLIFTTAAVFKRAAYAVHKIPFTVGILFGWLSLRVLGLY